jgi:CheY-like chemotaxis protein
VYSAGEGRGSTFTLKIPLLSSAHQAHSHSSTSTVEIDADMLNSGVMSNGPPPRLSQLLLNVATSQSHSHYNSFEGLALAAGDIDETDREGDRMRERERERERERGHSAIPIGAEDLLFVLPRADTEEHGCCDETSSFIPEVTVLDPSPDPVTFKCEKLCSPLLTVPPPSPATPDTYPCHQRFNILVVDDSKLNRKMLVRSLRTESHSCDEAEDGLEAIRMVTKRSESKTNENESFPSSHCYDAILMDFMMPIMDGPTATKVLRDMGYTGVIIGVTGNALPSDVEYFTGKGADKVLIKPVDVDVLLLTVHSLLSSC